MSWTLDLAHPSLELDAESDKDENKELLQSDSSHVNVDGALLLSERCRRGGHASADELYNERYNIEGDE